MRRLIAALAVMMIGLTGNAMAQDHVCLVGCVPGEVIVGIGSGWSVGCVGVHGDLGKFAVFFGSQVTSLVTTVKRPSLSLGRERSVRREEGFVGLLGDPIPHVNRPRNRATGQGDRAGGFGEEGAHVSGDGPVGAGHRRIGQNREARRRTQSRRGRGRGRRMDDSARHAEREPECKGGECGDTPVFVVISYGIHLWLLTA